MAELRQLVCVLPHADPVDEGGLRHRVLRARTRTPASASTRSGRTPRCSRTSRTSPPPTSRPGSPTLYEVNPERRHARCRTPMWRIGELFAGNLAASTLPGATDPLDPVDRKVPAELPPAVDRRLLELDAVLHVARQQRPDGARRSPTSPGATGFTPGSHFPRPYYEGSTATQQQPRGPRRCTTGFATSRPTVADKVKDSDRAVAARQRLRPVDRRPRHDQLSERHQRHHVRHGQLAAGDRRRRTGSRSTTCGTPPSTAAASTSTRATRSNWRRASSARSPTSPIRSGTGDGRRTSAARS